MAAIYIVAALIVLIFIAFSLPPVQKIVKSIAEKELSALMQTRVDIGELQLVPFNEVIAKDIVIYDRELRKAVQADRLGGGMEFWRSISERRLIFSHVELIGLRAELIQPAPDKPLNIDFIIKALTKKEPGSPPSKIDLIFRHIIIRHATISLDRAWLPSGPKDKMDFNHLYFSDLSADIALPQLRNDAYAVMLHNLRLKERSGFQIKKLRVNAFITPESISISNLLVQLPNTIIKPGDIELNASKPWGFIEAIRHGRHRITIDDARICPSDMKSLVPVLANFDKVFNLNLDVIGDETNVSIVNLKINNPELLFLDLKGKIDNLDNLPKLSVNIPQLILDASPKFLSSVISSFSNSDSAIPAYLSQIGKLSLKVNGNGSSKGGTADIQLACNMGNLDATAIMVFNSKQNFQVKGKLLTDGMNIGNLPGMGDFGIIAINGECDLHVEQDNVDGSVNLYIPMMEYKGKRWQNIALAATRNSAATTLNLTVDDTDARLSIEGRGERGSDEGSLQLSALIDYFNAAALPLSTPFGNSTLSGKLYANVKGKNIFDLDGEVSVQDLIVEELGKTPFSLPYLTVTSHSESSGERSAQIISPILKGDVQGRFSIARLPGVLRNMLSPAFPSFITPTAIAPGGEYASARLVIGRDDALTDYFKLPVKLLEDATITAEFDEMQGKMHLLANIPYMLQGTNKLIRNSGAEINIDRDSALYSTRIFTTMPSKNDEITLSLNAHAINDTAFTNLGWKVHRKGSFGGNIQLSTHLMRNAITGITEIDAQVLPSTFDVNDTTWQIAPALIRFYDKNLWVEGIKVHNGDQYLTIEGKASASSDDSIELRLRNINLDYIFSTLNIPNVAFGGIATGRFTASKLFSGAPEAYTDSLFVKGLTYNHGLLGDGMLKSRYEAGIAKVSIYADITDDNHRAAIVDGGIWVTRDSLSFGLDADKVNIRFLQPFMQAFTSSVNGRASGQALLYGTFKDINLRGDIFADTISMKVDYTNTVYSGSDSVRIDPGHIIIPNFKLYDKYGNSAVLTGWVRHNYFHDPSFEFNITDAKNLLSYDTDPSINPIWYGTVYGNGGATIKGRPGIVEMLIDMTTAPKSVFTFVLSDTQEAGEYRFLTFTDKRKEAAKASEPDTVPEILKRYRKMIHQEEASSSDFVLDLRASVTPSAEMILIMDPIAGDKIRAYGQGALQMGYSSNDDKLSMYGRYTLDRGTYNFSLQDVILKTFNIRPGSSISFNGDPYSALLDIDALYRVNTNLTDLDPSFANDRDLNRTNVPVDAVLNVSGDMRQPDIKFDIELPTLTQDVARKVKSVVSTEDMMSRQIIYLLALNRFYTPEYMGGSGNNNELASLGFSTLSSHLTNILGQLTPNWNIAPNLRTDQGDFSDLEVDLALSSRLFNNRLLLNGNLGYRDRSTSTTTFIGDFDLEYLLNRNGSLRLKAYNHFNDQNYYLKSALTTQGLGILYKHNFDRWFSFLRSRKKKSWLVTTPVSIDTLHINQ